MVMLCFVLDLRTLPPPLLQNLKQSLRMLGNYYALSSSNCSDSSGTTESKPLLDPIGLYYILTDMYWCFDEIKAAYSPRGDFNLHDFHHALNSLPTDNFSPEFNEFESLFCDELKLEKVLDEVVLNSWKSPERAIKRKVIVICSCFIETLDHVTRDTILDTTDKYVSLEFVFLERKASLFGDVTVNINHVVKQLGDLRNCRFSTYVPDLHVLSGLVKRWFQELKAEEEEKLQAHFIFKIDLLGSLNQLSCNLFTFFNPIIDGFIFCKTCRCHGIPLGHSKFKPSQKSSHCQITKNNLENLEIWANSVKIGEQTLYMPSFYSSEKLQKVSSPINFNVIQRTDLGSLSEGIIFGTSYAVAPSTFPHMDDMDMSNSKLNNQVFQAACGVLNSLDQGLVCSSNCNLETLMETSFKCFYILLPSEKGLMILRRLLASEEFLPIPDSSRFIHCGEHKEIENTVQESLLKIEINKYDPVQHERGFHRELDLLVKHSLHIRFDSYSFACDELSIQVSSLFLVMKKFQWVKRPTREEESSESNLNLQVTSSGGADEPVMGEWEQIFVEELPDADSFPRSSNSEREQPDTSPLQNSKKLDEKTSSILERLEIPREIKRKAVSSITSSSIASGDVCPPAKRPLIPFESTNPTAVQAPVAGQLIRPNFQRTKKDKIAEEQSHA